ncbi:MAG: hypothetical protein Pg6A_08470 [Termitinemataceae bacterium]|nr:MAG: hypothetical protein Pg6A_08470 [Termitinemataceae bacterium]
MSLNWKEIDLILNELNLPGAQIQKVTQSAYDTLCLSLYGHAGLQSLLIVITPGVCRLHNTHRAVPKTEKPLRFSELLKSRILNFRIEEAVQIGSDRIIRFALRHGSERLFLFSKLWSNAANVLLCDKDGVIIDAMRRLPKRGEIKGGIIDITNGKVFVPELKTGALLSASSNKITGAAQSSAAPVSATSTPATSTPTTSTPTTSTPTTPAPAAPTPAAPATPVSATPAPTPTAHAAHTPTPASRTTYEVRDLPGSGSFNSRVDDWYAVHGQALSLESLRLRAQKRFGASISRLEAALERLYAKEADFSSPQRLKEYGEIILANVHSIKKGDTWLNAEDFYHENTAIRVKLDPQKKAQENAAVYFEQYQKAKNGLEAVRAEIDAVRSEILRQKTAFDALLLEENPLRLQKILKTNSGGDVKNEKTKTGLSFKRGNWLIFVGRSAAENDELLRRHVKGNDLWLHARDFPGAYVFIKARSGKSVPLEILLDAGNLALFYSKGRNGGKGDLFYTQVKYLRRAKGKPRGQVLPTQEKNIFIKLDERRLKELELCKVQSG